MTITQRILALTVWILFSTQCFAATNLPVYQGFDLAPSAIFQNKTALDIDRLDGWSFITTTGGRLAFRKDFATHAGSTKIASLDNPGGGGVNELTVTIDATGLIVSSDVVFLSFDWYDHGDEGDSQDNVSIRGSSADPWLTVYSFAANSNNGSWTKVRDIDLSQFLETGGQSFSSETQVRFQQTDNFPINTDGISIEDVSIELANRASASTSPDTLVASMVDYLAQPVVSGQEIEYKISLVNPPNGGLPAQNVMFDLPVFNEITQLVPGSVITSQGTVLSGNGDEDESVQVSLGDIGDGASATIYFRAVATGAPSTVFTNQGYVSATNVLEFLTDDPTIGTGVDDPTQSIISVEAESLPLYQSFDNVSEETLVYEQTEQTPVQGLTGWTYQSNGGGQLSFRTDFEIHPGSQYVASLDNPGGTSVNQFTVTFDASSFNGNTSSLLLGFDWYDHSDEPDVEDIVSVRGSETSSWITIYDFGENSNNGAWTKVRDIDIAEVLRANYQDLTQRTQIRFQQADNSLINTDGVSIEDVSIESGKPATASVSPEVLVGTMVNYTGREITSGDEIEYRISLINVTDGTADSATGVQFELSSFGPETRLVPGSVLTSQGTVVTGNGSGDETVLVDIGELTDGTSATVYFRAEANWAGSDEFYLQGAVSSNEVVEFSTDDPFQDNTDADPTLAIFAPRKKAKFYVIPIGPDSSKSIIINL